MNPHFEKSELSPPPPDPRSSGRAFWPDSGNRYESPSLWGDYITFDGQLCPGTDYEIVAYEISTGRRLQLTDDAIDQRLNDVFDNRVAYVDARNGNNDIFVTVVPEPDATLLLMVGVGGLVCLNRLRGP